MALTDESSNMVMPVAPMYGGGNGGFGNSFGGDGWWIILLFILLANGGWGNGGFGGNAYGGGIGGQIYPWMNQANIVTDGFQNQLMNDNITSIRDGVQGISTQLCNGFADTQMALAQGFAGVEQGANARQMANMQTAFAGQTAMTQGFNNVQSQLAQCCCDNRLATADLKYTVATENCADRAALSDGIRDVIASNTANTQRILDQLCADKIDAKNDEISQLRQELLYARGQASQDIQTSVLRQGQIAEADAIYNRFRDCPVPTMPVYGMTPIFTCGGNNGCGCGGM